LCCCKGTHLPEGILTVRKAGERPLEYLIIRLTEAIVAAVTNGGSDSSERLQENVTLNFRKFNIKYTPQTSSGHGGTAHDVSWNIAANTEY
jgi:type VI secretion system secreted protein Hcp